MSIVTSFLIKEKNITVQQLRELNERSFTSKKSVLQLLIEHGHFNDEDLYETARRFFMGSEIDLDQDYVDPKLSALLPLEQAKRYGILPVGMEGDSLMVAMSDPSDMLLQEELTFMTGTAIKPLLCRSSQITRHINQCYQSKDSLHDILQYTIDDKDIHSRRLDKFKHVGIDFAESNADESSLIRLVNKIIYDAIEGRASDIHIEPQEKCVDVRYRIDGHLRSIVKIPSALHPRLTARLKVLAKLDIAEQRKVQEGRIKILINGRNIDLRVSLVPIFYGEKIVLRILDGRNARFNLANLGFEEDEMSIFNACIHKTQGVVLVTGPTGSGKTTTLYTALQHIKSETKNIVTIEDPIECPIEGINQLQLSRTKDVTFSNGLSSILRQDPDVILVGEIRDQKTAEIAFKAALTGHLVFSTLHTNSAVSSITRLLDIGLEPYLISSSVTLFVAQRLVRLICQDCRGPYVPEPNLLLKFEEHLKRAGINQFYAGQGCERCNYSGFYGRTSIFEMLRVTKDIKNLIFNRVSEEEIFKAALRGGMRTLIDAGISKVAQGITTLEEVAKVAELDQREMSVN